MRIRTFKRLWWSAFAIAVQTASFGFLALLVNVLYYRNLQSFSVGLTAVAILALPIIKVAHSELKDSYAIEPADWKGRWQFSVSDLLVLTLFAGSAMTLAHLGSLETFVRTGLPCAFSLTLEFFLALLLANRKGVGSCFKRSVTALRIVAGTVFVTLLFWTVVFLGSFLVVLMKVR